MSSSHQEYAHVKIRLEDIEKATNKFSDENLIGQGGFGKVYKGTLSWSGKLTNIAARRLHYDYGQGDLEFWTEISMLASLRHENLVSFIGYCNEEGEKIIINEYEAHESLDKHLTGTTLTWLKRLEICVDVARALNYIHCDDGHDSSVIHRNIKSSKILLDDKWKPKLSGFEHSKTNTKARRHRLVLAEITGTLGYVDPTYEKTGFVTHKSDVFSFGVVLFEVLCGWPRAFIQDQKEQHSSQFAKKDYKQGKVDGAKLDEIADPHLYADTECSPSPGSIIAKLLLNSSSTLPTQILSHVNSITSLDDLDLMSLLDRLLLATDRRSSSFDNKRPPSSTLPTQIPAHVNSITSLDNDLMSLLDRPRLHFDLTANDRRLSSFDNERPPSFVDQMPTSFGLPSPSSPHKPESGSDLEHTNEPTPSSSDEHDFLLEPLFTMKRLEQYLHSPNEEFLAQYAKYHYDEENLDDIIHPPLREQMDLQSLKIFSETAYNCLKEQRAQRPNIDQILRNLEKALELQMRRDNPQHETVTAEIELTSSNRWEGKNLEHLKIPLSDIVLATRNFTKRYIGSGTYGKVYKAELDLPIEEKNTGELSKKRRTVAIKCILEDKHGEEGFVAEIELLSSCKHPNIVSLLGFCDEGPHMILVYEHIYNGSLDNYLGRTDNLINLTWMQRLKICIDIAFGLNYLHTKVEDEERIIHRDIKSGNILLGKNWVAKIADFGLSRFHRANQQGKTLHTENIAGTQVYLDPEYMKTGRLKRAIDIYSFGVVLFEILSGKLANDAIYVMENENGIAHVARRLFKERRINELVDPKIMEEVDEFTSTLNKGPNQDSLKTFIAIAHQCVAETQDERPTTEDIIEELKKAISFQENNKDSLQMSFEEIESATQNFSRENIIGGGGFGKVYKGEVIRGNECNTIVAKRLDRGQGQGELHFLTELEILFEYKHENIIGLEGYCNEKDEKIIVYEHACNRSLDRYLNDDKLTWIKRLKICIDVARGLAFLHGGALAKEMVIHRDIKSANILLNDDWKAKISDFGLSAITAINQEVISKLVGTIGYVDPLYEITGLFTEKSDIYSFGVLLFEILYGRLLVPNKAHYKKKSVNTILKQIHEGRNVGLIVLEKIKKTIAPESLSTFQLIVSQCLDFDRKKRPTAEEVLQQLNKALEFQEDYEIWQPKLPKDYTEIIQMSKSPEMYSTEKKKDLYNMFSKGILLKDDKVWFSLGSNGNRNEMISARKFSYRNRSPHKWRHVSESRFKKVAEMLDISNLMIKIKTRTQFLSPDVMYGVHLVFKFSDSRQYSNKPSYVNLKYRKGREALHAYFATWRDDDWMMIELYRFLNHNEDTVFKFIVESFSPYYCGDGAIFVESIEFRAIESVKHEEIEHLQDAQPVLKSNLNVDQLSTSSDEILKKSKSSNEDKKLLWLSEVNGKKHLMLSAKKNDFSNVKILTLKPSVQSRFQEVIELLPQQVFCTNCTIRSHMLSQDTEYLCYLVFKLSEKCHGLHGPVKVRELLHQENKEAEIIYFISPSLWNLHDITRAPKQREDGWMEVNVWKFNSNRKHKNDCIPVSLKFISYEGTKSGLIVCGLEFRPM